MGRAPCCEKVGLKRGPWTPEEDQKLIDYINLHGHGSWRALPKKAGLLRCGKSCRLRWTNYLRPDIKRGQFSATEEQSIIQLHALLGNRWSTIASYLPKRTDNEIKNYWNTHLKKRLVKMGIDPATHKPKSETKACLLEVSASGNSSLSHMAQWESARLEAEARLARESKLRAKGLWSSCNEALSPNNSSSVSTWKSQTSDPSPKPEIVSCKALGAVDLMNSLQNWDESLQEQAKLLWPETWNSMSAANGRDPSCCSSPHVDRLDQGSPTSTLCSLEALRQNGNQSAISPIQRTRRLSWTDHVDATEINPVSLESDSFSSLGSTKYPEQSYNAQVGDIFQNACAELDGSLNGGSLGSSQSFQDLMFGEEATILSPSHTSSPWSCNSSDDELDVQKRDSDGVPVLASDTTSESLLGDLDFIPEDISSSKRSSFPCMEFGEVSGELSENVSKHTRESCETGQQSSFSALLTEEVPDYYWSSMLKQFDDSAL